VDAVAAVEFWPDAQRVGRVAQHGIDPAAGGLAVVDQAGDLAEALDRGVDDLVLQDHRYRSV